MQTRTLKCHLIIGGKYTTNHGKPNCPKSKISSINELLPNPSYSSYSRNFYVSIHTYQEVHELGHKVGREL